LADEKGTGCGGYWGGGLADWAGLTSDCERGKVVTTE